MSAPVRSNFDREKLIIKYMPLAKNIATCWGSNAEAREEAESECYLHLVSVIDATEDSKITKPFLAECLRNRLRDLYRMTIAGSRIPPHKLVHLDAPLEGGDGTREEYLSGHDVIADEKAVNPEAAMISKIFVEEMLGKLPVRQRKVISRYAGLDGMDPTPMTRVAKALRINRDTAYEDLKAATNTLRTRLVALGYTLEDNREALDMLRAA